MPFTWADGHLLFGWNPLEVLEIRADFAGSPFDALDRFLAALDRRSAAIAVGYVSYDLAERVEPTCASRHPACTEPLLRFALYDRYYDYDPAGGRVTRVEPRGSSPVADLAGESGIGDFVPTAGHAPPAIAAPASDFTRRAYEEAVAAAREYILAGDVFEVNLAQRFAVPFAGHADELYMRLRRCNPAPYAAMLCDPKGAVLSASPELFLRVAGERIVTRPIKGTCRRGSTDAEDDSLAGALLASEKDNAELAMVIDMERNDLGRVCRYGSVRVVERARVETFARVHHLVSTVEGKARPDVSLGRILSAAFPGGSVTGAPKVRAMQIIDTLEPCRRGIYTGAMGYVLPRGRAEFNIPIRTVVLSHGALSFHVGGAVTADSVPAAEYRETIAKAEGIFDALGGERPACAADTGEQNGE